MTVPLDKRGWAEWFREVLFAIREWDNIAAEVDEERHSHGQ